MTLGAGAESSWSGSHMTTIIQTSLWSAWPLPQVFTQPGSHLESRFFLILRTQPPTRLLTIYAVGRYFRLWKLSVLCPLVEEMRLSFLKCHWMAWSLGGRLDATEFASPLCRRQPRQLIRAYLLIGTSHDCWLDDEGLLPQVIKEMTEDWHQQVIVTPELWLDGWRFGELRGTTKPDGGHVWNGSEAIGSPVVYLPAPDRGSAGKPWSTKCIGMWVWQGTRKMTMYEVWRMINTI